MQRKTQPARPTQSAQAILHQISQVVHNAERERFELWVAGDLVGVLGYSSEIIDGTPTISVMHTVIYDEYTGQGLGSRLVRGLVGYVKHCDARLRPVCSFTKRYVDAHPGVVELAAV